MTNDEISNVEFWREQLRLMIIPEKQKILASFFKTGKGQYAEGDIMLGIKVPDNRKVSECFADAPMTVIEEMLLSPEHEFRLGALLALVRRFKKAKKQPAEQRAIVDFYLAHTSVINNWDLVDLSCPNILGSYQLTNPNPDILTPLSCSDNMWEKRIAIVSTLTMVRAGVFGPTLKFAEQYLSHPHDLIHKATGWLLREIGKNDEATLRAFLDEFAPAMPRTALRYAIERLDENTRKNYLNIKKTR